MSKIPIFTRGRNLVVTAHGPGKLHLYSYGSNANYPGVFGFTETTRSGISHFIISHSYTFEKYAFYWEGAGTAEYRIGEDKESKPVGRSWNDSSWCKWGEDGVITLEVSPNYFQGAINVEQQITCFLLSEKLEC